MRVEIDSYCIGRNFASHLSLPKYENALETPNHIIRRISGCNMDRGTSWHFQKLTGTIARFNPHTFEIKKPKVFLSECNRVERWAKWWWMRGWEKREEEEEGPRASQTSTRKEGVWGMKWAGLPNNQKSNSLHKKIKFHTIHSFLKDFCFLPKPALQNNVFFLKK